MHLEEFFNYKNQLVKELLTSESIVKLIDEDCTLENAYDLMYKNIFPYQYIPETAETGKVYICMDVDISEVYNQTFLQPSLYIWILVHNSRMRLPEGGVRVDKLCSEISKKINGSRYYGLGKLNLASVKRFAPMTDFVGKAMLFYAKEFNKTNTLNRPAPSNRKLGE